MCCESPVANKSVSSRATLSRNGRRTLCSPFCYFYVQRFDFYSGSRTPRNSTLDSAASSGSLAALHTCTTVGVRPHRTSLIDEHGESAHQSGSRTNRCQGESAPPHCGTAPDSVAADRCAPTVLAFAHQSDHLCVGFPRSSVRSVGAPRSFRGPVASTVDLPKGNESRSPQ